MTALRGVDILIFKGTDTSPIAGQRNVTINFKSDTFDTTAKSDYPNKTYMSGWMDWDASFDGVYDGDAMLDLLAVGNSVAVKIQKNTGTYASPSYTQIYSGNALVTEFSVEAGQDDIATFSISLQGTGAFTYPSQSSGTSGTSGTPA